VAASRDPEVDSLLATTRRLTGHAFQLSRSINEAVEELTQFVDVLEQRAGQRPYEGEDRRGQS